MSGSPCQDFSLAGLGKGGDKGSGTRSSLMYENIRIIEKLKPKYVIWENVKNLLSKKHIHNFNAYLEAMEELGYYSYYQVLNAKDYGIPQNRERVFTVSIRKDINKLFTFPPKQELKLKLKDLLEDEVDEKYFISDAVLNNITSKNQAGYLNGGSATLVNNQPRVIGGIGEKKSNNNTQYYLQNRIYEDNIAVSVTTSFNPYYETNLRIRKLTPKECWRLMGFKDHDFDKASKVCSNTQLYKQVGNSIVVNVLVEIFKELLKEKI